MCTIAVCFKLFIFSLFIFSLRIDRCGADVQHLTQDNFDSFINSNPFVLVLFKSTYECPDCDEALEEIERIDHPSAVEDALKVTYVADDTLGTKYGITSHPALTFFRHGVPALFDGEHIAADNAELNEWLELSVHEGIKVLTEDTFEPLTQAATGATTGDWFVVFYTPSCDTCMKVFPVVETVAVRKRVTMNFAKVDMEKNKKLVNRFKITTHLKGIFFRKGKMYEYEPGKFDSKSLTSFIDYWYMNVQAKPVPVEGSTFDRLTDSIAMNLKESFKDPTKKMIVIAVAVAIVIVCIAIVYKMVKKPSEGARFKYDKNY